MEKPSFKLATHNWIVWGIAASITTGIQLLDWQFKIRFLGSILGIIVGYGLIRCLLMPWLLSLGVWHLCGRKSKAGQITFNLILLFIVSGAINTRIRMVDQVSLIREFNRRQLEFSLEISGASTPAERDLLQQKCEEHLRQSFEAFSAKASPTDKKLLPVLQQHYTDKRRVDFDWYKAYAGLRDAHIMDFPKYPSGDEFSSRKQKVYDYIAASQAYKAWYEDCPGEFKKKIAELGLDRTATAGMLASFMTGYENEKFTILPLMDAHLKSGAVVLSVLEVLESNRGDWNCKQGSIQITDKSVLAAFNAGFRQYRECEMEIRLLTQNHEELKRSAGISP